MEIAILTSSRADFGFYKPLLTLLETQSEIKFKLVVFGTHLSAEHGFTVNEIKDSGYKIFSKVGAVPKGDRAIDIAKTVGNTHLKFAEFWENNKYDLIICIGDRYEMFAAVSSSIPFNIPIAHISGGEETLGAVDNVYRHSLSIMAKYHFTNTKKNLEKVTQIIGTSKNVFHTGSLAVDNINNTKLLNSREFKETFDFNIDTPFILFTFHPETIDYHNNVEYSRIINNFLIDLNSEILVTMPNADTMGKVIRDQLIDAANKNKKIKIIESLGSKGYYTALKNCSMVVGNSSSGIIEAASFSKYVINLGNRQLGREYSNNIIHCKIDKKEIFKAIQLVKKLPKLSSLNIYGDGNASQRIISELKKILY
tara:strand:+ start:2946 stop:4046 length:1101 start_codon:yes stop_codon:yes gene_type:complete